jgi:predicted RNase H-like HicB family nuclease
VTTGRTLGEVRARLVDALTLHFEGMLEDGDPIPAPRTQPDDAALLADDDQVDVVEVDVPDAAAIAS